MEELSVKNALRQLLLALIISLRTRDLRWLKSGSISVAVHLLLFPVIFLFVLPLQKPVRRNPVFLLSGGLRIEISQNEKEENPILSTLDEEAESQEDEDVDETEIDKRVLQKLAEERKDIFSLSVRKTPGIIYSEIEEEEDEDSEDVKEELNKEEVKKTSKTKPRAEWEDIFQKKGGKKEESEKFSEADKKIEELIASNPYESDSFNSPAVTGIITGSFFGEGEEILPDLLLWLPSDSRFCALVSLSILRSRSDRDILENTLKKLPYFGSVAEGSDLNLFNELDAIMIASKNPFELSQTQIFARHNTDEKLIRKAVSKHFKALGAKENWYRIGGKDVVLPLKEDYGKIPWVYFFPQEKVIGIVHISQRDNIKLLMDHTCTEKGKCVHLMGDLERLMRTGFGMPPKFVDSSGRTLPAGVVVASVGFDEILSLLGKNQFLPSPVQAMVVGRFAEGPVSVEGVAHFGNEEDQKNFMTGWQKLLQPLRESKILKFFGIEKLIDLPVWKEGENKTVTLQAVVPPERIEPFLALIRLITGGENRNNYEKSPSRSLQ